MIVVPFTSRIPRSRRTRQIMDLEGTGLRPPVWVWDATVAINDGEIGEQLGWINRDILESLTRVHGLTPGRLERLGRVVGGLEGDNGPLDGDESIEGDAVEDGADL